MSYDDPKIFEIPVYSGDEADYYEFTDKRLQRHLEQMYGAELDSTDPKYIKSSSDYWMETNRPPWKYNQIIGYIRLHAGTGHFWADLFFVRGRVTRIMLKKHMWLVAKLFDETVFEGMPSFEILQRINERLEALKGSGQFKGRLIDRSAFDALAPFVDWHKLLFPREISL